MNSDNNISIKTYDLETLTISAVRYIQQGNITAEECSLLLNIVKKYISSFNYQAIDNLLLDCDFYDCWHTSKEMKFTFYEWQHYLIDEQKRHVTTCESGIKQQQIPAEDFSFVSVYALRYCMERKSYMPSLIRDDIIAPRILLLPTDTLEIMLNDAIKHSYSATYDDKNIDKSGWTQWRKSLESELQKRNIHLKPVE